MGCSHSKQAVPIPDTNDKSKDASTTNRSVERKGKQNNSKQSNNQNGDLVKSAIRGKKNQTVSTTNDSTKTPKRNNLGEGKVETAWRQIWDSLQGHIVDPCDVRAVVESCMAHHINLLSNTELLLLQRRVRNVVRLLPRPNSQNPTHNLMNRFVKNAVTYANGNSNGNDMTSLLESRSTIEKFHQVDEPTFKRIFRAGNLLKGDVEFIDPLGSLFLIGSYLSSESIMERAASIAIDSSKDLVLDVNKNRPTSPPVPPPVSLKDYLPTEPLNVEGVNFQALSYLIALALRGTREQRLQLLFFISLSTKSLKGFMNSHPAGGLPTWLLEVGNDDIFSLASLTHYYYFGRMFCPNGLSQSSKKKKKFTVNAKAVIEWTSNILKATKVSDEAGANGSTLIESVASDGGNSTSGIRSKRRGSDPKSNAGDSSVDAPNLLSEIPNTYLMQRLADVREGRRPVGNNLDIHDDTESISPNDNQSDISSEVWTMDLFVEWANKTLDDLSLQAIFYRLLGAGIFPSPDMERDIVKEAWKEWQTTDIRLWSDAEGNIKDSLEYLSKSVQGFFHIKSQPEDAGHKVASLAWGNIGGFDGKGGLGHGVMYCVDKKWWGSWEAYTGWSWDREGMTTCTFDDRPDDMSNERILDRDSKIAVAGTLGSYEIMKSNVKKDLDYVLVPPKVWDILYEMYGGGPPLPRMVLPPQRLDIFSAARARTMSGDSKTMEAEDGLASEAGIQVIDGNLKLMRIPEAFAVATHPWVFQCTLCDASQPYRRGDVGSLSIRVMATPDQPLWRLYAEILVRLPIQNSRAVGTEGRGKARLWKRVDSTNTKDAISRYGPWTLLCKNRSAILPFADLDNRDEDDFEKLKNDWQSYTDHSTVEGCGLMNWDGLMFEYAVQNKNGEFTWPREAAAKAGRVKRIAEEDAKFKLSIRGFDGSGNIVKNSNELIGMAIDAMDSSGRWYQANIMEIDRFHPSDVKGEEDEENGDGESQNDAIRKPGEIKAIKVDFTDVGGHVEWINVASDRLALTGRFTATSKGENCNVNKSNQTSMVDQKAKAGLVGKKAANEITDFNAGKICTFPGYGACGLANLGNTCYANSAIQCISYMPLLRSYLLSAHYRANGDLNKDNPLGTGGKLLEEFAELLRVMWSGKLGERSPTRFRAQLGKQRTQFSGADQQDAQELLNYMLDVLHEDSNKVKKKPFVEAPEDNWVKINSLPRVGEEAWRRFLRRNRSIMTDVAMGQVLNTVTCPTCNFSSRNFDPFNLLSIPFPTVAEVMFECTIVRRATPLNAPKVLNTPRKNRDDSKRFKIDGVVERLHPPSDQLILERYVIPMSRLADIGDLRLRIQNLCGIPSSRLRLCKSETIINRKDLNDKNPVKYHTHVTSLPDKEGPCVQVAKQTGSSVSSDTSNEDAENPPPTQIMAFENTLTLRPIQGADDDKNDDDEDDTVTDEDEDEDGSASGKNGGARAAKEIPVLRDLLSVYGDGKECRIYDTDPLPLSEAMSRSLWPQSSTEFKLGLRVDAIDHRDHWFPGSVVEIIEGVPGENGDASSSNQNEKGNDQATKTKVRIHFDNFSSKWDEVYTIEHFKRKTVRPLYSHAIPRPKPTEFMVYHRYVHKASNTSHLFGLPFHLQCHNEWSTARAGAHILAQVSRYIQQVNVDHVGPISVDDIQEVDSRTLRLYEKAYSAISELIDLLLEYDRTYIRSALLDSNNIKSSEKFFRNPTFDATSLSSALVKKVGELLRRLPFELKVCTADSLKNGTSNKNKNSASNSNTATEEVNFPFSLMRTIGNYMNARHAVVLNWRDSAPADKKSLVSSLRPNTMYVEPIIGIHKSSSELLEEQGSRKSKNDTGSAGLHLGICLAEFCKVNKLDLNDNWKCPRCKDFREGKQNMTLWRLPDLLTFHIKRFNCSARWREKIMTKVNFPLTGLDMSEWCHPESPALDGSSDQAVYDLIAVVNHYGGMTGGHYVATCKATPCGPFGSEEVAYQFNGAGVSCHDMDGEEEDEEALRTNRGSGWTSLRRKEKDSANQQKLSATLAARQVSESAEPLWLQFDDDLVEPIAPRNVVSEMAYVLFYRRRRITQSNVAKYCTLE